jgi:hypothetical protein
MTRNNAQKVATSLNTKIESTNWGCFTLYEIEAPDGYRWFSGDCQVITYCRYHGDITTAEAYADLVDRMSEGMYISAEDDQ